MPPLENLAVSAKAEAEAAVEVAEEAEVAAAAEAAIAVEAAAAEAVVAEAAAAAEEEAAATVLGLRRKRRPSPLRNEGISIASGFILTSLVVT